MSLMEPLACPFCGADSHHVQDTRGAWRRRECENPECNERFSTREVIIPIWTCRQPKHRIPHTLRQPSLI